MNTLIFGSGFIGQVLSRRLSDARLVSVDITDAVAVRAVLQELRPTHVINAAGKTGSPNVDWCETHQIETYRSNVMGPLVLAEACATAGAYLLHLGSGCIFYGDSPQPDGWHEADFANPVSFYSRTKYAADLVLSGLPHVGIARLRMPIDGAPGPRNLITKLAGYRQVIDVENSVTVIDDLVVAVRELTRLRAAGVFHVVNPGTMRHRDLLELYRKEVNPAHEYTLITESDLVARGLAAKARSNCILTDTRLAALGIQLRPINVALRDAMSRYAQSQRQG